VLRSLPALLHVPAREGRRFAWIDSLLAHLEGERRGDRAGSREIVRRLSEIVLIEVLRASPECGPSSGALVALSDPVVRRALEAIHAGPERRWTLETLSARAGASRSVLAERFRAALGTSPMRYASRWRLERARGLLERRDLSVGEVALAVGYRSEAAFNRAFKEAYGAPPGRLRRLASQDASNTSQGTATIGSS
jgi:transcriptional regulator GlxA family with amidase domain